MRADQIRLKTLITKLSGGCGTGFTPNQFAIEIQQPLMHPRRVATAEAVAEIGDTLGNRL